MSRLFGPGDGVKKSFTITNASGALADADTLPTGSVVRNGTADGTVTVTITHNGTGDYTASYTVPGTYSFGDMLELAISASVSGTSLKVYLDAFRLYKTFLGVISSVQSSPSPTATVFAGPSSLSATDNFYLRCFVVFTTGVLAGIPREVTAYTGATKTFTVVAFPTPPSSGDQFAIIGQGA